MRRDLRACPGGIKDKVPRPSFFVSFVVFGRNVGKIVERNVILVIVVFKHVIAQIDIDIVVIFQDHIIIGHFVGFCLECGRIFVVSRDHAAFGGVQFNHFTRVRADDRVAVQVVKPFAGCRANALCTPFCLGHAISLLKTAESYRRFRALAIGLVHCQSLWPMEADPSRMTDYTLPGEPSIALVLRRSARARRITLRVSQLDGRVTLTLPQHTSPAEAIAFAKSKRDWIMRNLARQPSFVQVQIGTALPVEGRECQVQTGSGRAVRFEEGRIFVPGGKPVAATVRGALKERARARLATLSDGYSVRLGLPYSRITLRDTRSRWGSCTSDGGLMYSWRLILCPPDVMAYVAAHEVAHLAEMNHSPAFWSVVEQLFGPYALQRSWLRENGAKLHRFRFED